MSDVNVYIKSIYLPFEILSSFNDEIINYLSNLFWKLCTCVIVVFLESTLLS